jgi:beta-N-acetylglucosaminidase
MQASHSAYNSYISEIRPIKAYNYRKGLYFLYFLQFLHEVYQKRKREIEQKQVDAQKLISEAADRLTKATASKDIADILVAHALLQSGNTEWQQNAGRII